MDNRDPIDVPFLVFVIVVTILVVVIFEKLGIGGLLLFSAAVVAFVMFVAGPR